jgi:hypothetical protein
VEPGRLATAAGLGLLIAAGFAVGMLAGLVWEEPGLVFAHLSGGTEEVVWSAGAPEGQGEALAGGPPRDDRPADPQIRRERERAAGPETPPVAAAPVGRRGSRPDRRAGASAWDPWPLGRRPKAPPPSSRRWRSFRPGS